MQELCAQQRMFRNLVARNRDVPQEQLQRQLAANGGVGRNPVQLPFILIQVSNEIHVMMLNTDTMDAGMPPLPVVVDHRMLVVVEGSR